MSDTDIIMAALDHYAALHKRLAIDLTGVLARADIDEDGRGRVNILLKADTRQQLGIVGFRVIGERIHFDAEPDVTYSRS